MKIRLFAVLLLVLCTGYTLAEKVKCDENSKKAILEAETSCNNEATLALMQRDKISSNILIIKKGGNDDGDDNDEDDNEDDDKDKTIVASPLLKEKPRKQNRKQYVDCVGKALRSKSATTTAVSLAIKLCEKKKDKLEISSDEYSRWLNKCIYRKSKKLCNDNENSPKIRERRDDESTQPDEKRKKSRKGKLGGKFGGGGLGGGDLKSKLKGKLGDKLGGGGDFRQMLDKKGSRKSKMGGNGGDNLDGGENEGFGGGRGSKRGNFNRKQEDNEELASEKGNQWFGSFTF